MPQIPNFFVTGEVSRAIGTRVDWQGRKDAVALGRNVLFAPQGGFRKRPGFSALDGVSADRIFPWHRNDREQYIVGIQNSGHVRVYDRQGGALTMVDGDGAVISHGQYAGRAGGENNINAFQYADSMILVDGDNPPYIIRDVTARGSETGWHARYFEGGESDTTIPAPAGFEFHTGLVNGVDYGSGGFVWTTDASVSFELAWINEDGSLNAGRVFFLPGINDPSPFLNRPDRFVYLDYSVGGFNGLNGETITGSFVRRNIKALIIGAGANSARIRDFYENHMRTASGNFHLADIPIAKKFHVSKMEFRNPPLVRVANGNDANIEDKYKAIVPAAESVVEWKRQPSGDFGLSVRDAAENEIGKPAGDYFMAWNNRDGFPQVVSYKDARLIFAASAGSPSTFWASVINDAFNFLDERRAQGDATEPHVAADYAITRTLDTFNTIVGMHSGAELVFLTDGGEWSVAGDFDATSPAAQRVRKVGDYGSARGVGIGDIDDELFYATRTAAVGLFYEGGEFGYVPRNLTAARNETIFRQINMSPNDENGVVGLGEIAREPARKDGAANPLAFQELAPLNVRRVAALQPNGLNGAYLVFYLLNNGEMRVFHTLKEVEFAAWARWDLAGAPDADNDNAPTRLEITDIAVLDNDFYILTAGGAYRMDYRQFADANNAFQVEVQSLNLASPLYYNSAWYAPKRLRRIHFTLEAVGDLGIITRGEKGVSLPARDFRGGAMGGEANPRPGSPGFYSISVESNTPRAPYRTRAEMRWILRQKDAMPLHVLSVSPDLEIDKIPFAAPKSSV